MHLEATLARRSLLDAYKRVFEVVPADTVELLQEAHRLRYQVYCVENPFEDPTKNLDGLERDRYDEHALHALLFYKADRTPVGTTRLILPCPQVDFYGLPMFELCPDVTNLLPAGSTAEFSRFAVSKQFRRRTADALYGESYSRNELLSDPRRVIPHLTLGLMTTALEMSRPYGIDHVCAVMEPSLLRLLARVGIHFIPFGPLIEHHGLRQPCYSEVGELLDGVKRERPEIWEVITDSGRLWVPSASGEVRSAALGNEHPRRMMPLNNRRRAH